MAIPKAIEHMRGGSGGLEIIPITSTDGLTYTGTAKSIKKYEDGMIIGFIPNMNSAATSPITNITININGLGPLKLTQYYIKKEHSSNGLGCWHSNTAVEAGFLYKDEGFIGQIQLQESNNYILPINPGLDLSQITNGTMGSNLSVSSSTTLNGRYLRNVTISTSAPSTSTGSIGDIWIQYSAT